VRLAIALGDPSGIGPEIALRAAADPALRARAAITLVGDADGLRAHAAGLGLPLEFTNTGIRLAGGEVGFHAVPLMAMPALGRISAEAGAATLAFLDAAVALAQSGAADAVISGPHNETAVNASGVTFAGYPGYLARKLGVALDQTFLMLSCPGLRVTHVTLHQSLSSAIADLRTETVLNAIRASHQAGLMLGYAKPRIGVCGLNPHAGEGGLFGDEDDRLVLPAVRAALAEGIDAHGPYGADLVLPGQRYDIGVAMIHDQGHVAVKMLSPRGAAALTIGLPILFSSVAHGTSHDIAGQGRAEDAAMRCAIEVLLEAKEKSC
jgi:4-hydroxy-L-threonine phosphate dehydrogenase PdxA